MSASCTVCFRVPVLSSELNANSVCRQCNERLVQPKPATVLADCTEEDPCEKDACSTCCPHDEHDHGTCLTCGLNRTEHYAGIAESHFEGER
jgi:hypothetical protein